MAIAPSEPPLVTERQREILQRLARGDSNKEIASALGISEQGVKSHISRMLAKHGATNRTELVAITRAWGTSDSAEYAGMKSVIARMRRDVGRSQRDGDGHAKLIGIEELAAGSRRLSDGAAPDVTASIERLRKVVTELNVAIELAREIPVQGAARGVVSAVRKRAVEAEKHLAALERALAATRD